jgi:hypothetical protein
MLLSTCLFPMKSILSLQTRPKRTLLVCKRHCIIFLMSYIEEFEDAKWVIRIRISKNRQHNGQKKNTNDKQRSTKHTHKNKDRVTRTPIKTGGEDRCSGRISSSCPTTYPFLHIKKTYFIELTP